jgi:radial spoke head protein 1
MHGKGRFEWQDGSSYEGNYQFGKKHGMGKFTFIGGNYYEGLWLNGKQNDQGTLFDSNAKLLQTGFWKDGVFQGNTQPEQ